MSAFTAVRGGPLVEELTLEISSKQLSSVTRDRSSWLLKLSLDFLNIMNSVLSKKHSKSCDTFVVEFILICL